MKFRDKRSRVMFCSMLVILMFTVFSPNIQFQISTVHAGDWETVEYIDSIGDLNIEEPIRIEGQLIHQEFVLADSETDYVDATQSQLYGSTTTGPPSGMGEGSIAHSTLQEESYVSTSYSEMTKYTGGNLPAGWTNTGWTFKTTYVSIVGFDEIGGNFYTNTHDMSSYAGVRVKFDWRNDGSLSTEEGDLECNSYEGGNNIWFESPVGNQGSFTPEEREDPWHSTGWNVKFTAKNLDGDIESWEGFRVDNIYLQGKVSNTYYRFEAVYRFDSVAYVYGTERLYIDYDSGTSQEGLTYYAGTTTDPTDYIGDSSGAEPDKYFDVHDELTGTPFYVKIVDTYRSDGDQDAWLIDQMYLSLASTAPVNDQTPICTNLDDGDNLYARYRIYNFSVSVTDLDGATDVSYVELSAISGSSPIWTVKYLGSDNSFSETFGDNLIELTGSVYTKSGINLDIWFGVRIEWAHADINNLDLRQRVIDDYSYYDEDDYTAIDYDYDTDLTTTFTLDDGSGTADHGNYNSIDSITANGTVYYEDSGGNNYPTTAEVDMYIRCSDVGGSDWDDTTLSSGYWEMTVDSDDVTGTDTYYVKAVQAGDDYDDDTLLAAVTDDEYIADALTITITGPTDNRQNLNANASGMVVSAVYDEGGAFGGTLTLNNTDYNGDGTVVRWGYTVSSASGDTYGVTAISSNDDTYMIWDQIEVYYGAVSDDRTNIDEIENPRFRLRLKYDNHSLDDGTHDDVWINGSAAGWGFALTAWYKDYSQSSVGTWNFVVTSASEDTYGITAFDSASAVTYDQDIIWDRVIVMGYNTNSTDNRDNINDCFNVSVWIQYEHDSTNVTDGTIVINGDSFAYNAGSGNWTALFSNATVSDATWDTIVASGNTHGITYENQNGKSQTVIWDRVQVRTTVVDNGRVRYGTSAQIRVTLWLDYEDSYLGSGDTVNLNGTGMGWDAGNSWFELDRTFSVVGEWSFYVNSTSEVTYGITALDLNGNSVNVIWDRIYAVSLSYGGDTRINAGTSVNFDYELHYDFDEADVTDGTITINSYTFSHQGSGIWRNTTTNGGAVGALTFNSIVASGNTHGITATTTDSNDVTLIWDRVIWNMYTRNTTANEGRQTNCSSVSIGETVNITARFLFEHDSTAVTSGTILLEGESMTHIANGYWYLEVSNATALFGRSYQWNSFVTTGNTYDITVENSNSKDFYIIWDSIYIDDHGVEPDARHNMGEYPILWVTAKLTYDASLLDTTSDYIKLADQTFQWNGSYLVNNTFTMNQVGQFTLETNDTGHNEATYGITEIEYYSFTTIFDRVLIYAMWSPTETDNRTNYGDTEMVYVSFVSEHDNSSMTAGTFELNSTGMSYVSGSIWQKTGYSYSAVVNYTFNVNSASWSAYGIDQINYNDWNVTYYHIVWDRVKILTTVSDDGRIDYDTNATLVVTAELEYDSHALGSGDTLYLNNTAMSWNGSHFVLLNQDFAAVGIWNYYVNTSGVNEATYGITVLNLDGNSVNQIWDRVYLTSIHVSDSRASYGTDVNVTVTAKAEYDNGVLGSGDSIYINGTLATWDSTHSVFNVTYSYDEVVNKTFHVTATTEVTYDITILTNDTYVWIVWDRLKITDFAVDNVIPDPLQMVYVNLTIVYEYDSEVFHFDNGTITMIAYNVTWDVEEEKNMHWNDTNWQFNHTMPGGVGVVRNFNISAFTDSVYAIVVINWNGFDNVTAGSDRVIVISYVVSDDRDDINDYIWVNVTLQLESNGTAIIDGDVVINGYIFTHISNGDWRYNSTSAAVTSITFDTVVAENNTYSIETVNQNGQYTTVIWDRVVITNFWVIDNRTDINTDVQIRLTAELDFDDTSLGSGDTIYINSTLATWDAGNLRFYITENYGTALNKTYGLTSITETAYTITEVTNTSYIWQIWDQFVLTRFNSSDADGRTNLDETEYIHFGMKWDYDDEVFQSGNGTIYLNSTLLTWNATQNCWSTSWVESSPISYLFAYASHTDNVYGITVIDWDVYDNVTQTWDRIGVTVATNMTWTVVGYNVMISYTSVYESDDVAWSGYTTVANTSMVFGSGPRNENLTFTTVVNKTFYATVISEDANGVTGFTTTTVWCVWDNMTASAMYGADVDEYSKTFVVLFGELSWQHNSSGIGADWVCHNIRNGTSLNWATSLADNYLEPLKQELPIPLDWDVILYSNNATKTISGRSYNFQWFSVVQTVVLGQSVMVEGDEILDITIVVSGTTNVDFTWTIYNELVATGENGTVSDVNDWEISFSRNVTYGLYNFSIYFDAALSGNRWYNSSYFNDFDLRIEIPEQVDDNIEIKGISSVDCEWRVYNRDTTTWTGESGTITGGNNYFQFLFVMQTATGKHNYSLYFNVSESIYIWKNGTYYIAPIFLTISNPVYTVTDEQNFLSGTTNIACDWYVYNNDTEMDTGLIGVGSFAIEWDKNTTAGYYIWGVKFDDGTTVRWVNGTFEIPVVVLDVDIEDWSVEDVVIEITGTSNLDIGWYVYNEGVYSTESGSETEDIGFTFNFAKNTTIGKHNFSVYFNDTVDGNQYRWFNRSYTISAVYGYSKITLYNSEGTGLADDAFIIYINDTRYSDNEFHDRTDYDYNITVTDYFGYVIYSSIYPYSRHINIGIAFYVYKVRSELQGQAVYFNLTRTGGARFSQHLLPDEILKYYLVAGEYIYEFRKVAHNVMAPTFIYYEGVFTLSCDKTHIIDGTNLRDLENAVELIPDRKASTKAVEALASGVIDMISIMQLGMWGLGFLIVIGMAATATEEEITKDGKIIKKRKIPKQLRRFAFKSGSKNPKSKKIPKGTGRSSWKGVTFKDDIKNWRDKK